PAGITKCIENFFTGRVGGKQLPVFPLINKKAGFLTTLPVNLKGMIVFTGQRFCFLVSQNKSVAGIYVFGKGVTALIIHRSNSAFRSIDNGFCNFVSEAVNSCVMRLKNRNLSVYICDQPREVVAFGMNQPENICFRIDCKTNL